nr:hypothetical protein [uncultured Cellulosilyticum sp.]
MPIQQIKVIKVSRRRSLNLPALKQNICLLVAWRAATDATSKMAPPTSSDL